MQTDPIEYHTQALRSHVKNVVLNSNSMLSSNVVSDANASPALRPVEWNHPMNTTVVTRDGDDTKSSVRIKKGSMPLKQPEVFARKQGSPNFPSTIMEETSLKTTNKMSFNAGFPLM